MKKIEWGKLIGSLVLTLGVGFLSGIVSGANTKNTFKTLNKPALSPPAAVFPIVWTILFTLMGISLYIILTSESKDKKKSIILFFSQLIVNFSWPIVFFNLDKYLIAFFILILLIILVVLMIGEFKKINKTAAYLQIPYLLWLVFAGYLNLSIVLLN